MKKQKLKPKEIREKKVLKAIESIRKLEKRFEQDILSNACGRYNLLVREKRNTLARKKQLEEELAKLKGKI